MKDEKGLENQRRMWGNMKKIGFVLILLISVTMIFAFQAIQINIYKWNIDDQKWEPVTSAMASGTGRGIFTTESLSGNVKGFIPISFFPPDGKRINFKVNVDISRAQTKLVLKPLVYSHIFGKWTVDNMYLLFNSTNDLKVSYSLQGDVQGYHIVSVDEKKNVKNSKEWKKMGKNTRIEQINLKSGSHEFYLWLGFDKTNDKIFVGPIVFDTYIVPNI